MTHGTLKRTKHHLVGSDYQAEGTDLLTQLYDNNDTVSIEIYLPER